MILILDVVESAPDAARRFELSGPHATVGRAPECEIVFDEPRVSRLHGRFAWRPDGIDFIDLGSSNGSGVRRAGQSGWAPVAPGTPTRVEDGDAVVLATLTDPLILQVRLRDSEAPAVAVPQTVLADAPLLQLLTATDSTLGRLLRAAVGAQDWGELAAAALGYLDSAVPRATARGGVFFGAAGHHRFGAPPAQPSTEDGAHAVEGGQCVRLALRGQGSAHGWLALVAPQVPPTTVDVLRAAALVLGMAAAALSARSDGVARREALQARLVALEARRGGDGPKPLGDSPSIERARRLARRLAVTPLSLVITGETGTGKEVFSRAIHRWSRRADRPFVPINCAAIPDSLLESELFGHVRGAFTGAHRDHAGVFEQAHTGTLFLDEIGEMPLAMQAKLLRVLEDGRLRRIGDRSDRAVDVRVLCATHRDLTALCAAGAFRDDLRFRLEGATIELPPLRARDDDLLILAHHFLRAECAAQARRVPGFSPGALTALAAYPFPGNVRELRNEVGRALALTDDGAAIAPEAFSDRMVSRAAAGAADTTLKAQVLAVERRAVQVALDAHGGNVSAAARALGLSRAGIYKLIGRVGVTLPDRERLLK